MEDVNIWPEWAIYKSVDFSGTVSYWSDKPLMRGNGWGWVTGQMEARSPICPNWKTSLVTRSDPDEESTTFKFPDLIVRCSP